MPVVAQDNLRNVALVGHASAGKTTLADAILFAGGKVSRLGSVGDGTSEFDFDEDEQSRKHSLYSALGYVDWRDHRITIIDTPGYPDFFGEACGALHAVDAALIVVCAYMGVEVQTAKVWRRVKASGQPTAVVINKMDAERADFDECLQQLEAQLGMSLAVLQVPLGRGEGFSGVADVLSGQTWTFDEHGKPQSTEAPADVAEALAERREQAMELAAEASDELIEKYLESGELSAEELTDGLRTVIAEGKVVPVFCCAGEKMLGVTTLLDAIVSYLPAPTYRPQVTGHVPGGDEERSVDASPDAPTAAIVFKTVTDPYVGRLSYFRVFSGEVRSDSQVLNAHTGERERISQVFISCGKEQEPLAGAPAGVIAAVAKLESTLTGHTLCAPDSPLQLPAPDFPSPPMQLAVRAATRADEDKLGSSLVRLAEEDPTFQWSRNAETGETIISGLSDLHLDVTVGRMRRKFGVEVETSPPKVAYRETIRKPATAQGKFKRQTGGRGQYGDVHLEISPLPSGQGFEFEDRIVGGVIPGKFLPAVEKGVVEAMQRGVIAGYPVVDIKAAAYDGSYHSVDSSDMAFKIAGSMAFKEAFLQADAYLLEPIMQVDITIPDEQMGDVIGDLNSRRGRVLGMEPAEYEQVVHAEVPLAEMGHYAADLRSLTGGRGSYSMEFSRYEEVPAHLAAEIVARAKAEAEAES